MRAFDSDFKEKILKKFSELFDRVDDCISEKEIVGLKEVAVMSKNNVFMVIAKSEEAKRFIFPFVAKGEMINIPEYVYSENKDSICMFGIEYLSLIINFFKCFKKVDQSIYLGVKSEYPLMVENKHFKFILAPRVKNY